MPSPKTNRLLPIVVLTALVVAMPAAGQAEDDDGPIRSVVELPVEFLEEHLPVDAAEAGLDFAPRLLNVSTRDDQDADTLATSGLDVTEHAGHGHAQVVVTAQEQLDLLDDLGLVYEVVTPDMIALERDRILADAAFASANQTTALPSERTTYRMLPEFEEEIDQLVVDAPGLARKLVIGQSIEGRDIVGIEIGEDVDRPEDGRPVFLLFGAHHAREWPSADAAMEFAHDLVETHAAGDSRTVDLLGRARAIIVPVSNPDGFDASRQSGELIDLNSVEGGGLVTILATPGNAYKRKNCRVTDGVDSQPEGTCLAFSSPGGFGIGIDLNRNYGGLWGGPGADGADASEGGLGTASAIYRGPAPFSEPETAAIRELISTRQVTTLISNHTFSNLLLRPVGVQPFTVGPDDFPIGFSPDECFTTADGRDLGMQALGERMTAQVGYTNQFGWELYDTTGTTEDYSYNATGGYGYTFEIGPEQFHPPFEEVVAEYTGTTAVAQAITPETAPFLTTSVGRDCPGAPVEHDIVGGGLREAYFLALDNAANTTTHAVLTGEAPAGAEIRVERTGEFPLWDNTKVEDTVTTTMTVPAGDVSTAATGDQFVPFDYHVNPSTRPFVRSRAYVPCDEEDTADCENPIPELTEVDSLTLTGDVTTTPPAQSSDHVFEVPADIDVDAITLVMSAANPEDDWDLTLLSPDLVPLGTSASGGSAEEIQFYRVGGVQPGEYVVRVTNFSAATTWDVQVTLADGPDDFSIDYEFSPDATEQWTMTCSFDGEVLDTQKVEVDRGESVDVGEVCVAAAGAAPQPAPDPEGDLAATGGGAAVLAAMLLGGAVALAGRRRQRS